MPDEIKESRKVVELSVDDILPNRFQPRIKFDDSAIFELSESIKAHGVFQPIIVRPIGDKYEIIAGERRYKASVLANKKTVPAIVMDLNDNDTVEIALIENVQRANLTPIEEAISYKKILDMGYMSQADLAQKLGKTQSTIANKLRLLNLDEDVQEALLENKISERHARSILRLKDYGDQKKILDRVINERLTVRKTDEEIEKMLNNNQETNVNNNIEFQEIKTPDVVIPQPQVSNSLDSQVIPEVVSIPQQGIENIIPEVNTTSTQQQSTLSNMNNEVIKPSILNDNVNTSTVMGSEQPIENVNIEAPTVMNIDSIEDSAEKIYQPKPLAPMSDILASSNDTPKVEPVPMSSFNQEEPQNSQDYLNPIKPGKFFNFVTPDDNEEEEENNENIIESKNFNFDNLYNNVSTPTSSPVSPALNVVPPVETTPQSVAQDNVSPFFGVPTPAPEVNPTPAFNSAPDIDIIPPVAQAVESVIPVPNNNGATVASQPTQDNSLSTPFGFGSISSESPTQDIKPAIVETPVVTAPNINDISIPEYQNIDTVTPKVNQPKNIMSAVSIIRNAVTQLQQQGYNVDVDEIDLETMYQLIVKIEK